MVKRAQIGEEQLDIRKEIRRCVDTGEVFYGLRNIKRTAPSGKMKFAIISINAPSMGDVEKMLREANVKLLKAPLSSLEMGSTCGKPYPISYISVFNAGNSQVDKFLKQS